MRQHLFYMEEQSQIAEARRKAVDLAGCHGFNEAQSGKVAIVITEIAQNLIKHARSGQVLVRSLEDNGGQGLEILSLDRGPGIADITRYLQDGCSTAGSQGNGLGAICRLSELFDLHSVTGRGTALVVRLWTEEALRQNKDFFLSTGVVCMPKEYPGLSGDGWATGNEHCRGLAMVVDGLGHGPLAKEAADEAEAVFKENIRLSPAKIVEAIHHALRHTRGAAVAIAEINLPQRIVSFAGVGNISGLILASEGSKNMVSYNGTAGAEVTRIREFTYPWPDGATLIMHSDGIKSHWNLENYPGLLRKHPSLIAGVLWRDYSRGRDDATVLVAKTR